MTNEKVRILHTNDLHSQLDNWPAVTKLLKEKKQHALSHNEHVLLFDIGDHCDKVHPMTEALAGKGNVELLNNMEYDGVTIGNNEGITLSKEQLDHLYDEAEFPVILSNLIHEDGSYPEWTVPHKVFTLPSGVSIGVTGVTVSFPLFYKTLGWRVTDPFAALKRTVARLSGKVDAIICLSHLGLKEDEKLANEVFGIDVILGAHTHHVLERGKKVNNTWINQAGRSGTYIGDVQLSFKECNKGAFSLSINHVQSIKVNLNERDEETEKLLSNLAKQADNILKEPVTHLAEPLEVQWYQHSDFPKLLAETLREWCHADLAMVNSGVLLKSLEVGPVTLGDLHECCPHPINPANVVISGENLINILHAAQEESMIHFALKGFGFRGKVLGYMMFDNLKIAKDAPALNEKSIFIGNKPLQRDCNYTLATVDMFTLGQLYPAISTSTKIDYFMPEFLRDLLAWKLRTFKTPSR
ncbi:bifunctional metallophosphatase/5'-nucleotidase [Bacillus sp. A301a_S52]|nr:bifunctional metallophosphatase/5'-nucleotidase [Bacillus sp. A301a_S52]